MKKIALFLALVSSPVMAIDGFNPGSSFTLGSVPNHHSTFASAGNPAMAPFVVPEGERWRMNYSPSVSFSVEVGDVDDFADDLDELIDLVETSAPLDESTNETLARFNDVLVRMGRNGYLKNSVNVSLPVTPLYYKSDAIGGAIFVDINRGAQVSVRVIDEILRVDENQNFDTDTAIYLKSGIEDRFSVGYGAEVFELDGAFSGKLFAGVTLNYYAMELSKQVIRIMDLDGEEVSDVIRDEYDNNLKASSGFGIDLGMVWDADWYRVGVQLDNINSPKFSYGDIGVNCAGREGLELNSCVSAQAFIANGRLTARETYKKHAVMRVAGSVGLTDRWFVNSSLDLAEYDDIVGDENQWLHLSTNYQPSSRFIPAVRFGYQQNLAGSEISSFLLGATLFKCVNLDFEMSSDSVDVDGDNYPRRLGFALSVEESF